MSSLVVSVHVPSIVISASARRQCVTTAHREGRDRKTEGNEGIEDTHLWEQIEPPQTLQNIPTLLLFPGLIGMIDKPSNIPSLGVDVT
jgi:hypothetical protein